MGVLAQADSQKSGAGVGPVKSLKLGKKIDAKQAKKGKQIFDSKCTACHQLDKRYVGPALQGVTQRRQPEWIMNMMLNSAEMIQQDPIAKQLFEEFLTPMPNQNLTEPDARAVLEYFRKLDQKKK